MENVGKLTILEMQELIAREVGDHFKINFSDYSPKHGGIVEIDHEEECVFSLPFQTVVESYELVLKFFSDLKNGSVKLTPIKRMSPRGFLDAFCQAMNIPKERLLNKTRKREIVQQRQILTALIYKNMIDKYSLAKIGSTVNQNHATVLHSSKTVSNLVENNRHFRIYYNHVVDCLTDSLGVTIKS